MWSIQSTKRVPVSPRSLSAQCAASGSLSRKAAAHARSQGAVIDGELAVGDKVGPLTVVAVPGKSPGEVALHWTERGLLFVGDAVIGNPPGRCGLLREKVMDDPPRLKQSVRDLLRLEFDALLFGDGTPILHDAKPRLAELVETLTP